MVLLPQARPLRVRARLRRALRLGVLNRAVGESFALSTAIGAAMRTLEIFRVDPHPVGTEETVFHTVEGAAGYATKLLGKGAVAVFAALEGLSDFQVAIVGKHFWLLRGVPPCCEKTIRALFTHFNPSPQNNLQRQCGVNNGAEIKLQIFLRCASLGHPRRVGTDHATGNSVTMKDSTALRAIRLFESSTSPAQARDQLLNWGMHARRAYTVHLCTCLAQAYDAAIAFRIPEVLDELASEYESDDVVYAPWTSKLMSLGTLARTHRHVGERTVATMFGAALLPLARLGECLPPPLTHDSDETDA